jgi:hypothetical protein
MQNNLAFRAVVTIKTFGMEVILKAEIYSGVYSIQLIAINSAEKCNRF